MRAVLFDLDGVLVDSEPYSMEASNRVLAEAGIIQTPEERRMVFGRRTIDNYRALIKARNLDLDANGLVARKNRLFAELIEDRLKTMPGVLELLAEIKDAGLKVAVVSSSSLDRVNATLEEVGLILEFDLILSGDCCVKGKPDPEPFLLAADKLGVNPKDCVVVEDAEAGILAAKAAGMKVVAVESPNTHGQDLSRADAVVKSTEEVNVDLMRSL
jgi:beta-phosphoglucomutase